LEVMKNNVKVLSFPKPKVSVFELADSSINLAMRPYVKVNDYWEVYFDILE